MVNRFVGVRSNLGAIPRERIATLLVKRKEVRITQRIGPAEADPS